MIVKPVPGAQVRDPATRLPLAAGAEVDPTDPYFARALIDGDLVEVTEKAPRSTAHKEGQD